MKPECALTHSGFAVYGSFSHQSHRESLASRVVLRISFPLRHADETEDVRARTRKYLLKADILAK